jgi:glycosyltransferase involved in cell wall biosynthesis
MDISLALPTYNGTPYIKEQLDSIVSQSRPPDEIVISDDGSSDGTIKTVEDFAEQTPINIEIFENPGNGVCDNFEHAISQCSGDLIALADQDDIWKKRKLEKQIDRLSHSESVLVFHDARLVNESGEELKKTVWESANFKWNEEKPEQYLFKELLHRNFVQGATIVFDSSLLEHILPFPDLRYYDHYIAFVAHVFGGIEPLSDELLLYRQHSEQDLGAPPGYYSVLRQIKIGLNKEPQMSIENAKHWDSVQQVVNEIPDDELRLDKQHVEAAIKRRVDYSTNRKVIHTSQNRTRSVKNIISNFNRGYYTEFGYGPSGILNIGRDILGVLNI